MLVSASDAAFAIEVQNCGDGGMGSGSLRDAIAQAGSGETIDMSQLPSKCGAADSVITLSNGEIVVAQDSLKLQGPSSGSVTIEGSANGQSRIVNHTGMGLLVLNDLHVANGNLQSGANSADGGCIRSKGTVFVTRSTIRDCTAEGANARGGGVYAYGSAILLKSTVSGNKATGTGFRGVGGGIYARTGLNVSYSTLSANTASTFGGALYIDDSYQGAYTTIDNSTISGNSADQCGAATLYSVAGVEMANSTISSNSASVRNGGLCVSGSVGIANSTLAFSIGADSSNALAAFAGSLTLQSVLIGNNLGGGNPDAYVSGNVVVYGSNNLISTSQNIPMNVIVSTADPKLRPLASNGGPTATHALASDSPARGAGNDIFGLLLDQRGRGYPRASGANFEVDIGAVQFDSIFYGDYDP